MGQNKIFIGADRLWPEPAETIPGHANIRGGAYYSNDKELTPWPCDNPTSNACSSSALPA